MRYLSAKQVAEQVGVSISTVRTYLRSGKLPSFKIGKLRRISEVDLDDFVTGRKHRNNLAAADHRMKTKLLDEAVEHMADWESKKKKMWVDQEERTAPVLGKR